MAKQKRENDARPSGTAGDHARHPGRGVDAGAHPLRLDDDVAEALMDTPIEASIHRGAPAPPGVGALRRLPALGGRGGFFVTLDAGTVIGPGSHDYTELDELLVAVVRGGSPAASALP